jgi:hypothetical protein
MKRLVRSLCSINYGIVAYGLELAFGEFAVVELNADLLTEAELFEVVPFGILGAKKRENEKEGTKKWEHRPVARCAHSELSLQHFANDRG